jgi:GIY-YIG catalytic domain
MMSEMHYLPTIAGIYFAIEEDEEVAYIGQSLNIRQRWRTHHVQGDLCDLTSLESARRVRLAWLAVEDAQERDRLERSFIRKFRPRLNQAHNGDPQLIKVPAQRRVYTSTSCETNEDEMLSPSQFAEKIDRPYSTVMAWLKAKRIVGAKKHKVGKMEIWLIPRDASVKLPTMGRPSARKDVAATRKQKVAKKGRGTK